MTKTVLLAIAGPIATITFNRPEAMNGFNKQMADEFAQITAQVREDRTVRAVLLQGAGQLFMAGGDIHFFHQQLDTMPAGVMEIVRTLNAAILDLMHMPKPVLACVQGSVAGVGMSFMMAADLVMAADTTKFTLAYGGLGISPDGGASYNLPRLAGTKKALELIMLSELFDADTARQYGLVNWVVPAAVLTEQAAKLITKLANGPTQAYGQAKRLVNQSWDNSLAAQLEAEGHAFAFCSATEDFKTGVRSFLRKEKPVFTGE